MPGLHRPGWELLDVPGRDRLGEGPWWDPAAARLWWIDILGRRIRSAGLAGGDPAAIDTGSDIGFAVPDDEGGIIAGLREGLFRRRHGGDWTPLWPADYDSSGHRINDGKTDRRGRIWFGTMHDGETSPSAHLYRVDADGCRPVLDGVSTSNGLGWSPDDRTFYYTDSPTHRIWAFDYDLDDGTLANRRLFAQDPAGCFPDGLTVDAEGCVWGAKWDGSRVVRYRPDGRVDATVELPVRKPTSVAFCGPDLSVLAVTSAAMAPGDGDLAGSVFLLQTSTHGVPQQPARVPGARH
ncbi:MAG: SMP-30/gluconolactonase/LRE family protein [Propionicimonas sp.]|nr:SMP-30/gluconolactonase/LRE family protein [Propionicimonas sp.]